MKGHTLTRLSDVFTTKWRGRSCFFEWAGRDRKRAALHRRCTVLLTSLISFSRNGTRLILSNDNNYILFLLCTVFESDPQFPLTQAAKTNLLSTFFHITTLSVHEMSFSSAATSKRGRESQWERGGSREDNIEVFGGDARSPTSLCISAGEPLWEEKSHVFLSYKGCKLHANERKRQ